MTHHGESTNRYHEAVDAENTVVDVVVIGAGVVGLACALALRDHFSTVAVVERNAAVGRELTSRNSGVIHAGLYNSKHTLKTTLCIRGRHLLYELAPKLGVSLKRCGKLVVAVDATEELALHALWEQARQNCVEGISRLDNRALQRAEPLVRGRSALYSAESGIIDSVGLAEALARLAEARGVAIAPMNRLVALERSQRNWRCVVEVEGTRCTLGAPLIVNAAGLDAPGVARLAGLDLAAAGLEYQLWKGSYFALGGRFRRAFTHLVYPIPPQHGLGVHLTLDLDGAVRLGPNAERVSRLDYQVDPSQAPEFARLAQRYLPTLRESDLVPAYAGIRPRLAPLDTGPRDFHIAHAAPLGAPGLFNVLGIESPGLTACLAIGEHLARLVAEA